jgi:hypothetical protein
LINVLLPIGGCATNSTFYGAIQIFPSFYTGASPIGIPLESPVIIFLSVFMALAFNPFNG